MDTHLGYKKYSMASNNSGNSRNGSYQKNQIEYREAVIHIPCDRNGQFDLVTVSKHESHSFFH